MRKELEDIFKTEDSSGRYDSWKAYRDAVSDMLLDFAKGSNEKKLLAIWGAGGCNDFDIKRLSGYFKLVLIDRDIELIKQTKKKYMLSDEKCACIDMRFYDIDDEHYDIFYDLLKRGEDADTIIAFLSDVLAEALDIYVHEDIFFDYSVAAGLISQLNARFAALLYLNKDNYSLSELSRIEKYLLHMDDMAVKRTSQIIERYTKNSILWVLEYKINGNKSNIYSNCCLEKYLEENDEKQNAGNMFKLIYRDCLNWQFTDEKSYIMKCIEEKMI